MDQIPLETHRLLRSLDGKDSRDMLYITPTRAFADYVSNLRAGSAFSNCHVGRLYGFFLNTLIICCFPFLKWENGSDETCIGPWAKARLVLAVLALASFAWVHGRLAGFFFGMGRCAKKLRRYCLSQGIELERGETSGRDRLEALVRELLQEENPKEEEKSPNGRTYENTVADIVVKRIDC
jgi:hypothetical protein